MITGGLTIRDRRRKPDEPFNPFAANANQIRQKKRSERGQGNDARPNSQNRSATRPGVDTSDLKKKQEEARKRLGSAAATPPPTVQKPTIQSNTLNVDANSKQNQQVSRADRLAELRKQSQESVKKTESILDPSTPKVVEPTPVEASPVSTQTIATNMQTGLQLDEDKIKSDGTSTTKNVFKQIVTQAPKKTEHRRRRRSRHDDSGGGRQPKVKKLNRQRYNDYKYAARDILDDESVPDEHRSNLLGQIWAKGERIGVEATYDFISEKEEELIITADIAQQLRDLVRALTTRR